MAPVSTRSQARSDPGYVFDRFTPIKRPRERRSIQKEEAQKKQKQAREKLIEGKREGFSADSAILDHFGVEHVTGVRGCQNNLDSTVTRLLGLAAEIEGYNKEEYQLSEKVRGDIEAFCGKARLLVTSKLQKQYQRMIDDALNPTYEPPTKVSDLAGFWDMVEIQIEQTQEAYDKLLKLKENDWVELEEAKPVPTKVLKPKVINKPAIQKSSAKNLDMAKARAEKMKAFKAQMKAKMQAEQEKGENDENTV